MLVRGNGDGAETNESRGMRRRWMRRATIPRVERRGDEVAKRERNEIPAADGGEEPTDESVTEKRTEKEKTAPKALLYLSYNYHNRALHRTPPVPTDPTRAPRSCTRPQPQIGNSRIHFPFVARSPRLKLFAVGRRPSSRKDANDSNANTQSWYACSAQG